MKIFNELKLYFLLSFAAIALTGCLSKKKKKDGFTYSNVKENKKSKKRKDKNDIESYAVSEDSNDLAIASLDNEFQKVYFDFDKTDIRQDQRAAVDYDAKLAQQAKEKGASAIVVIGKADSKYINPSYNVAVSQQRAEIMKKEFELAGLSHNVVKALGVGDSQPEVKVAGAEPLNRCAVVQVVRG